MEYLQAHEISYTHPDKELLLDKINIVVQPHQKAALVGNNGTGKSTLLKILARLLEPSSGVIESSSRPYYVPQHFGQYNHLSVAEALQVDVKLKALAQIRGGSMDEGLMSQLNEDWNIEERTHEALDNWGLGQISLEDRLHSLSGGEKTKVFLAGMAIHVPTIILLDEPTNHLDGKGRSLFHDYMESTNNIILAVSHDRMLLDMLEPFYELARQKIKLYQGNYHFYREAKESEIQSIRHNLKEEEKKLKAARKTAQDALERKQKSDARGTKKHKGNVPPVVLHQLKNKAEKSSSKLKGIHHEKIESIRKDISRYRKDISGIDEMKMDFDGTDLYTGKILINCRKVNYRLLGKNLWKELVNFDIRSGDRVDLQGDNGSGKTTLIKLLLGITQPSSGTISRPSFKWAYIDQEYSMVDDQITVYEMAQKFNDGSLQEHEIKIRLFRYLFDKGSWNKSCRALSGGEKMKLALCCLMISTKAPDLFALDEPTNNLDLQNIEILTSAIRSYHGTVIAVSHDKKFLEEIGINRKIQILDGQVISPETYR